MKKKNTVPDMNESGWYGKVAHYGDFRIRYRDPIVIFCESKELAEKFFIGRAKRLPGFGGGRFPGELYCFSEKLEAKQFFLKEGFDRVIFEAYVVFED